MLHKPHLYRKYDYLFSEQAYEITAKENRK